MSVSLFLLNIKAHLYHFGGFHIGTTLYNVGFTLSEWLYSVWQSLSPFTTLQMAWFGSCYEQYSTVRMTHIVFVHHSVAEYLGCFHVLVILNRVMWTLRCLYLLELRFFTGICGRHYYETHSDRCQLIPYFRFDFSDSDHFQCWAYRHRFSTYTKRVSKLPPEIDARNRGALQAPRDQRFGPARFRCTGDSGPSQSQPGCTGLRGGSTEGSLPGCLDPTPIQLWHETLARAKDRTGSRVKRPRLWGGHCLSSLDFIPWCQRSVRGQPTCRAVLPVSAERPDWGVTYPWVYWFCYFLDSFTTEIIAESGAECWTQAFVGRYRNGGEGRKEWANPADYLLEFQISVC